jgi:hypothetical protein
LIFSPVVFYTYYAFGGEHPIFQLHRIETQHPPDAKHRELRLFDQAVHRDRMYLEAVGDLREGEYSLSHYGLVLLVNQLHGKPTLTARDLESGCLRASND